MYAFGNPTATGCAVSNPQADYEKPYDAADSVDGKADRAEPKTVCGNFGQLLKLKAAYPKLKVLISLGGWTLIPLRRRHRALPRARPSSP